MSTAVVDTAPPHHPVALTVTDDLQRSRLTTFFRPILAIPHLVLVSLWAIAAYFAFIIAWFAALFTGRVPLSLHSFMSDWLRYTTRVTGYTYSCSPIRSRRSGPAASTRSTRTSTTARPRAG